MLFGWPATCTYMCVDRLVGGITMRRNLYTAIIFTTGVLSAGCSGCDGSGIFSPNQNAGGADNAGYVNDDGDFVAPDGNVCADATPCGNCDQDCRLQGNPFLGGGGAGGDAPGTAGGGGTGYDGEACVLSSDCRGMCGGAGVCEGYGSGGYNGDSCLSASDCRGECGGDGICAGSGNDPSLFGGGAGGDDGIGGGDDPWGTGGDGGSGGTGGGDGTSGGSGGGDGSTGGGTGGGDGTGGGGTSGGGGTGGGGTPDMNTCLDLDINLDHAIPTISLLVDQSGSMLESFGGGMNRWEAEYQSLMDPNNGVVQEIQGAFRIGMSLYSSNDGGPDCPLLADVRPELNNYDAINRVFAQAQPIEDTPTGEAILGSLRQFDVHPEQGRKIMIVATDGEPDTCAVPDPQNGQPESVAAAQEAFAQGVEVIMLSVGDEVGAPHLEDMANAGVGLPVGGAQQAPYYTANDPMQLAQEMGKIIDSARSCIFRVEGGIIDPGIVDQSTVTVDGQVVIYGDPNGWIYHQNRQTCQGSKQCIELQGDACTSIQDGGQHNIHGDFLCTYYDPENPPIGGGTGGDGTNDGGTGGGGTGGTGGTGGSGGTGGGPTACVNPGMGCEYDSDCCSGKCSAQTNGICVLQ